MGIGWKKFLAKYGLTFFGFYIVAFFLLVTLANSREFPTFPGDILINPGSFRIYLPFTSAGAFAVFFLIIIEIYKNMR